MAVFVHAASVSSSHPPAEPPPSPAGYLDYIKAEARALRAGDRAPTSLPDWQTQRAALKARLAEAWGGFDFEACPLDAKKLGELKREGYRVEKIVFQTLPGVIMTANAYVPDQLGKVPAILAVHGHWKGAKQDPVVQARCIGLAKLGFFVLAVDALGAGERGIGKALGEYHGDMTAATLLPAGLTLSGLQVYENMRAVDYLLTRPEVDGARIGITGASGGGNQAMYAGAWDERFKAVMPVCSVGNYQAYLGVGCCLCEVVPGALGFTEEWGVLGMIAPRALLVANATQDGIQFSVGEARKSLAAAQPVFDLHRKSDHLRHVTFESPHAYNQPMREAMYGWMSRHLKGDGDGSPRAEPSITTEDPEALRCYPGDSRPDDFVTIPKLAAARAEQLLRRVTTPTSAAGWRGQRVKLREQLERRLHGQSSRGATSAANADVSVRTQGDERVLTFQSEPLIELAAHQQPAAAKPARLAVLLDLEGAERAQATELAPALRADGWTVITLDLRATGKRAVARARVGRAPDHNPAEWALWLGRPLIGQWVVDVRRLLDAFQTADGALPREVAIIGLGSAGLVATNAAALDARISHVVTVGALASYVTDVPYEKQWLGVITPMVLRDVGDVSQAAALIAPRRLVVASAVNGAGQPLGREAMQRAFAFTRAAYGVEKKERSFVLLDGAEAAAIVRSLN